VPTIWTKTLCFALTGALAASRACWRRRG
jgi:hypothetical protein